MSSGAHTFDFRETFLDPQVLPPPPVRHALFAFLVALASIVHIGTAGWGEIHNGAEGLYASGARTMLEQGRPLLSPHEPPLTYWLVAAAYELFGVSVTATRLPVAAAVVATVALTFLIGEQLAGYWRGFVAGLIYLCTCGAFVWGRIVTADPFAAALISAAIYCGICGYRRPRTRRWWFAGWWVAAALAYLTKGAYAIVLLAAIFLLLALFYREARLRFALLLHWPYVGSFIVFALLWHACLNMSFPGWFNEVARSKWLLPTAAGLLETAEHGLSLPRFLLAHVAWWSPAVLLVLGGAVLAWRKIIRPREIEAVDALPLCWMAVGFLPLLFAPTRQDYHSMSMWSGFALWAASAWDRMPRPLQLAGIALAAIGGFAIAFAATIGAYPFSLLEISYASRPFGSGPALLGVAAAIFCVVAACLAWQHRERLAITILMLAMLPGGLAVADATARLDPFFSFASAARFLHTRLGDDGEVILEAPARTGSSLGFHLRRGFFVIHAASEAMTPLSNTRSLTRAEAIEKMAASHPVYLIIHKKRVPFWQQELTRRFHIFHQATTCGAYVVLHNHP